MVILVSYTHKVDSIPPTIAVMCNLHALLQLDQFNIAGGTPLLQYHSLAETAETGLYPDGKATYMKPKFRKCVYVGRHPTTYENESDGNNIQTHQHHHY